VGKELRKMEEEDNMGRRSKFLWSRNLEGRVMSEL